MIQNTSTVHILQGRQQTYLLWTSVTGKRTRTPRAAIPSARRTLARSSPQPRQAFSTAASSQRPALSPYNCGGAQATLLPLGNILTQPGLCLPSAYSLGLSLLTNLV